jgi:hypothetical protein
MYYTDSEEEDLDGQVIFASQPLQLEALDREIYSIAQMTDDGFHK